MRSGLGSLRCAVNSGCAKIVSRVRITKAMELYPETVVVIGGVALTVVVRVVVEFWKIVLQHVSVKESSRQVKILQSGARFC
jgi:hypothetical protein